MKCLVIGGNGFVGSHVVDELVALGHEVTVFDRFSGGAKFTAAGVRQLAGDFMNVGELADALNGQEIVYHLLSMTNPASAEADPLLDVRTNLSGSIELFRLAADAGVQHMYFVSTGGAIYGDHGLDLITEDVNALPISPYGIGKLAIEGYLHYFRRMRGLNSTVLRLSNPYGPRQHPLRRQGVIPIFLRNLSVGAPLSVFGDGSMIRDYVYVSDAAKMIVAPLGRTTNHDLYNVGSGVAHSVSEILDAVRNVTGIDPVIEHRPVPPTFVHRVALDVERFRTDFGMPTPLVHLEEGIARTWQEISQ